MRLTRSYIIYKNKFFFNKKNYFLNVVADSHYSRDGRFIEQVGFYDPMTDEVKLNEERIMTWLNQGAQPSDTVKSILSKHGIIAKFAASKK